MDKIDKNQSLNWNTVAHQYKAFLTQTHDENAAALLCVAVQLQGIAGMVEELGSDHGGVNLRTNWPLDVHIKGEE